MSKKVALPKATIKARARNNSTTRHKVDQSSLQAAAHTRTMKRSRQSARLPVEVESEELLSKDEMVPEVSQVRDFAALTENYRKTIILRYFRTTTKGKILLEAVPEQIDMRYLNNVSFWLESGYSCSDYASKSENGRSTLLCKRFLVRVPRKEELMQEIVEERGLIYIHAAVPGIHSTMSTICNLWLVSMINAEGTTVWPPTWLEQDQVENLCYHSFTPHSENWKNDKPWELNIVPTWLIDPDHAIMRIVGLEPVKENLPFKYYFDCQIRQGKTWVGQKLSIADLTNCFQTCNEARREIPPLNLNQNGQANYLSVPWRNFNINFSVTDSPILFPYYNPIFWDEIEDVNNACATLHVDVNRTAVPDTMKLISNSILPEGWVINDPDKLEAVSYAWSKLSNYEYDDVELTRRVEQFERSSNKTMAGMYHGEVKSHYE